MSSTDRRRRLAGGSTLVLILASYAGVACAQSPSGSPVSQPSAPNPSDGDIIVTAQKREQSLNDVGMSISALSADTIESRGVARPEDLAGLVPSLTVTRTQYDSPSYTLRGVGFYDSSLAASPTVSMYLDQVPLVFPIMARGAPMDLERVEVLKGPQGTVFGQNSTGGLINYIAAKPTDTLSAGIEASYARFGRFDAEGFVSGPITPGVNARLAIATTQGGAWQFSATRPGDELGNQRFTRARFIMDADPAETLRLILTINGWIDKSDTMAAHTIDDVEHVNGEPTAPILDISRDIQRGIYTNPRVADWDEGVKYRRNDWFVQTSLRAELDLTPDVMLTSISAYSYLHRDTLNDGDGTPALNTRGNQYGHIKDFSQELRLSGAALDKRLNWSVGGNYQRSTVDDFEYFRLNVDGGGFLIPGVGTFTDGEAQAFSRIRSLAAFANGDFQVVPNVTLTAGLRYTSNKIDFRGCTIDAGPGDLASIVSTIQQFVLGVPVNTGPGLCITLKDAPGTPASELYSAGYYASTLDEDNVSWRAGENWSPFANDTMVYANLSRGFKAGSFPRTGSNLTSQLQPVTQEKLTAYEIGFKTPIGGRMLQLNGAAFYYDYRDKQIRGRVSTIFGQLEQLLNIPRSRIWGVELDATLRPVRGLTISGTATYINSKILKNPDGTDYVTYPARAHDDDALIPITGSPFPFTPKFSSSMDVNYEWGFPSGHRAFIGGALTYQSRTKSTLTPADINRPFDVAPSSSVTYNDSVFSLRPYTLVNVQAGFKAVDDRWRVTLWGRNIFNTYYTPAITRVQDTIARYSGEPATYGVTVGVKY